MKKIHIAKQLGITHSCVSKVLRKCSEDICLHKSTQVPGYWNGGGKSLQNSFLLLSRICAES
ncbi:hypothetical protein ANCDUO_01117 [Ancylostoma duodenale]|uniref:Paired domain-containing protein n=1 Tax=Ancylostoma duodenale TaxID=51022 RepID=A0A0C2DZR3_9BILA|nr:hypothetical protein ANCDUO_01117 [Ancylostoma duodenale]